MISVSPLGSTLTVVSFSNPCRYWASVPCPCATLHAGMASSALSKHIQNRGKSCKASNLLISGSPLATHSLSSKLFPPAKPVKPKPNSTAGLLTRVPNDGYLSLGWLTGCRAGVHARTACPRAETKLRHPNTPPCPMGMLAGIIEPMAASAQATISQAPQQSAAAKLLALEARLRQLESLMVAYSGGVDSAFLAATAHRVLGSKMLAVLADSPSLARRDMEQASAFAASLGMPLQVIATEELDRPEYARNDANRCFHCKDELFLVMETLARRLGFTHIAYGMNADDTAIFAPASAPPSSIRFWRRLLKPASPSLKFARSPKPPAIRYGTARPRLASRRAWNMAAPSRVKFWSRLKAAKRACACWASASFACAIMASWRA